MVDIEASARKRGATDVDAVTKSRVERAAALEAWAEAVDPADLRSADTAALRHIAELARQRDDVDAEVAGREPLPL